MEAAQVVSVNGYRYIVAYMPNVPEIGYICDHTKRRIQINGLNPNRFDELAHINFILGCIQIGSKQRFNNGSDGQMEIQPTQLLTLLGLEDMI